MLPFIGDFSMYAIFFIAVAVIFPAFKAGWALYTVDREDLRKMEYYAAIFIVSALTELAVIIFQYFQE